jgi:replicative DNA helicase
MDDTRRNGRHSRREANAAESFSKLYERPLPYSLEAEMALLGSLLIEPRCLSDVVSIVTTSEDFYSETHRAIFQALFDVYDKLPDADMVAILDTLRDRGKLELIGGGDYLSKLALETPSAAGAIRYAKTVADKARLRRLIDAADQMIYDALNSGEFGVEGASEIIDAAESSIFEIAQENQKADPQALSELLARELERIEAAEGAGISGLATGFTDLDRLLSGLQNGEMIILAARPSMGKTAAVLNMAEQIANGGTVPGGHPGGPPVQVGVFSLEMSKSSLVQRLLSAFSEVDSHRMRTGHLNKTEMSLLRNGADALQKLPIFIDDTPGLSVLQLRARARRMASQHGVRAIMIDYLQLLSAPGSARESRQVEVSAISRGLKALARELNIPIVCLSQLNRASEQREGNRPRMSDLRESGSIEQDADVVMLLHREDYYHQGNEAWLNDPDNQDKIGIAELIIAKQRNGPTGMVKLTWDARTTRFRNHATSTWGGSAGAGFGAGGAGNYGNYAGTPAAALEAKPIYSQPPEGSPPDHTTREPYSGGFPAGPRTGPVENFRDGGGPDRDDEDALPPF